MNIKVPQAVVTAWDRFGDWANVPVHKGRVEIRRIDIILIVLGIVCVAYYSLVEGWMGALKGALAYVFVLMASLWVLR